MYLLFREFDFVLLGEALHLAFAFGRIEIPDASLLHGSSFVVAGDIVLLFPFLIQS